MSATMDDDDVRIFFTFVTLFKKKSLAPTTIPTNVNFWSCHEEFALFFPARLTIENMEVATIPTVGHTFHLAFFFSLLLSSFKQCPLFCFHKFHYINVYFWDAFLPVIMMGNFRCFELIAAAVVFTSCPASRTHFL